MGENSSAARSTFISTQPPMLIGQHKVGYDASSSSIAIANDCHTSEKVNKTIVCQVTYCKFEDA